MSETDRVVWLSNRAETRFQLLRPSCVLDGAVSSIVERMIARDATTFSPNQVD